MRESVLDLSSLYAALDAARQSRGITWRQLALDTGVSQSTFSRISTGGHRPDVDAFLRMVGWLGMPAELFTLGPLKPAQGPRRQPELMTYLVPAIRSREDLGDADKRYLEEILYAALRRFAPDAGRTTSSGVPLVAFSGG